MSHIAYRISRQTTRRCFSKCDMRNTICGAICILTLRASLFLPAFFLAGTLHAHAELRNGMDASVVLGQPDFNSNTQNHGGVSARSMLNVRGMTTAGDKVIIADSQNHRSLIFQGPIQENFASAVTVVGQADFVSNTADQGGGAAANTQDQSWDLESDGKRLFIPERQNNRVLIFNQIPTTNNASADVVVGQATFAGSAINQGGTTAANTLDRPRDAFSDGTRLFIADTTNDRVLIFNKIPTSNNASADIVLGQVDFISNAMNQGGNPTAHTMSAPTNVFFDGQRLFVSDTTNHRVLIWNELPTANNTPADVVVGQRDFQSVQANQGGSPGPNTINDPYGPFSDGTRLFIAEASNHRVIIFNKIPTENNASADIVIGQSNFFSNTANQGGGPSANTLNFPFGLHVNGNQLFVCDSSNRRVLIFNMGTSNVSDLGPQFSQGKAVVGKVYWDFNGNGKQDEVGPSSAKTPAGKKVFLDMNGDGYDTSFAK